MGGGGGGNFFKFRSYDLRLLHIARVFFCFVFVATTAYPLVHWNTLK